MAAVDLPLADLDDLGAAVLPIGNSVSVLYAEKAKQPPSVVNIETQEVCSETNRILSPTEFHFLTGLYSKDTVLELAFAKLLDQNC